MHNLPSGPTLAFFLVLGAFSPQTPDVLTAELKPQTLEAFAQYVQTTEARIAKELTRPGSFLYIEGLPEPQRSEAFGIVRRGEVYMEQVRTRDASGTPIEAPDGLIHHWIGAVFIPGVTLPQVLDLVEDYDHHQDVTGPRLSVHV